MPARPEVDVDRRPFFTVIVPAYGRQEFLDEAIESVVAQTYSNWELIVVDDGSPHRLEVVNDVRIRVIRRSANGGFAAGFNDALSWARGAYIAVLADDDAWTAHRLANAFAAHAVADVVACRSVTMGEKGHSVPDPQVRLLSRREIEQRELVESMCALSLPRSACPRMDEEFRASQDIEWAIRVTQTNLSWATVESQDFVWRRHSGFRNLNGLERRIRASKVLLRMHAQYYRDRPTVKSWRQYRIAVMERKAGRRRQATFWGIKSFVTHPSTRPIRLLLGIVGDVFRSRAPDICSR